MDWSKVIKNCILIFLSVIGVVAIIWLSKFTTNFPVPATRSTTEFIDTIAKSHKELFDKNGSPIFKIIKVEKPTANWYVLELTPKTGNGPDGFVIINDPYFGNEYMKVIAGPESKFSIQDLSPLVPDSVKNSLIDGGIL